MEYIFAVQNETEYKYFQRFVKQYESVLSEYIDLLKSKYKVQYYCVMSKLRTCCCQANSLSFAGSNPSVKNAGPFFTYPIDKHSYTNTKALLLPSGPAFSCRSAPGNQEKGCHVIRRGSPFLCSSRSIEKRYSAAIRPSFYPCFCRQVVSSTIPTITIRAPLNS